MDVQAKNIGKVNIIKFIYIVNKFLQNYFYIFIYIREV